MLKKKKKNYMLYKFNGFQKCFNSNYYTNYLPALSLKIFVVSKNFRKLS